MLILSHTKVSDLKPIKELKNLKELDLTNTQFTKEQITELQKHLPDCDIDHDFE